MHIAIGTTMGGGGIAHKLYATFVARLYYQVHGKGIANVDIRICIACSGFFFIKKTAVFMYL
jgi:hypothetical protein